MLCSQDFAISPGSMTEKLPSGTVTFLFSDIEGSTPLWEHEPGQMQIALEKHNAILHACITAFGGNVYKIIGDAFQAAFEFSSQAVRAAVEAQRGLAAAEWPTSMPLRVRMGLHAGYAIAEGADYQTTHTLNRVARIMSAAHGGQILLSEAVMELIRDDLPEVVSLRDMGLHQLKGLTQLEHIFQVVVPELPAHFPPLNTLNVSANNLPSQLTSFIGREREVEEVKRLLAGSRLLTLTGSGGCGKTRLSIQVAREVQSEYPNGVWLVELSSLADPALIPQSVADVLGLMKDGRRPVMESLADFLRARTLLLVLDNCEHLLEGCAQLSETLLLACPTVRIMASSREDLGIAGESVYRVPSLEAPELGSLPALESLAQMGAVRLFVERAATARPGFSLNVQNAAAIAQICKRLDGIPLALELAAARLKVLSVEQIAARLDDRFRLLTGGSRTALPRQQTLRAMIDWSYSLLSEPERILFRRLAVFVSGWTLEAAEFICSGNGIESSDVLDLLTRLVDKSVVTVEELAGEARYRRLETIRQYSREKFLETDEVGTVRDRHLEYYLQFCETAEEHLQRRDNKTWTRRMEAEQDNLRSALDWGLVSNPDRTLRMVGSLRFFWSVGGHSVEGFQWTRRALERIEELPPPDGIPGIERQMVKAKALASLAWLYVSQGDNEQARITAEKSAALYRTRADEGKRGLAFTLIVLAQANYFLGHLAETEAQLRESIALSRALGDTSTEIFAISILVRVMAVLHGNYAEAQTSAEEALRIARAAGFRYLASTLSYNLGLIASYRKDIEEARRQFNLAIAALQEGEAHFNVILAKSDLAHLERRAGNYPGALELYRETIVAFRDFGQRGAVAHQLECFAFIAIAQNQFERALRLLGAAEAWREWASTPMTPDEQVEYQEQVEIVRQQVDPNLFTRTWAEGRALLMEEAVQYAITDSNRSDGRGL